MMPADGLDVLERFDAIYLGAVGRPDVPDHVTLWGPLLPIRQRFDLYLNVRPVRLLPGVLSPLRDRGPADIDMIVVRGELRGRVRAASAAAPTRATRPRSVFRSTCSPGPGWSGWPGTSFELARSRRAQAGQHHQVEREPAPLRDVGRDRRGGAPRLPGRAAGRILVDAAAAYMISSPGRFDVVGGVEPVRRHPHRHRRGDPGRHGHGGQRQHQARPVPARHVRAGARVGAGHRRDRPGQPGRCGLGRAR